MKKQKIFFVAATMMLACFITFVAIFANADYSSTSDPLITLSYLNETLVPKIKEEITDNIISAIKDGTLELTPEEPEDDFQLSAEDLKSLKYTVVYLTKGQKLFANGENTESLEIVLRAGEAVSVSPFEDQGIADLTASTQLYNGDKLVKNNYCIIPRGQDGRGIETISDEAYFLVRGVYEIE